MKTLIIFVAVITLALVAWLKFSPQNSTHTVSQTKEKVSASVNPLSIDALRNGKYPGSDLKIEQTLESGGNYNRYIASYFSKGNKIYGLLTVPNGQKPKTGWPIIIFNHGFIPPTLYKTTERYVAYQDAFARDGFITYKSDYRGHGDSRGDAVGGYGSNAYTIDVLNALASVKRLKNADPNRVGMWAHSMGGFLTLRALVVDKSIKAAVIWSGVVADYPDLINNWRRRLPTPQEMPNNARRWRQMLIDTYGKPDNNNPFWRGLSANNYLSNITAPIQIHATDTDEEVPVEFSRTLDKQLKTAGKKVEYYEYAGDDHNLSASFDTAMQRSVAFFEKNVK